MLSDDLSFETWQLHLSDWYPGPRVLVNALLL